MAVREEGELETGVCKRTEMGSGGCGCESAALGRILPAGEGEAPMTNQVLSSAHGYQLVTVPQSGGYQRRPTSKRLVIHDPRTI